MEKLGTNLMSRFYYAQDSLTVLGCCKPAAECILPKVVSDELFSILYSNKLLFSSLNLVALSITM